MPLLMACGLQVLIIVVLLLVGGCASRASVAAAELPFAVGAARVSFTPSKAVPLAGYGDRFLSASTSVHDEVFATAITVRSNAASLVIVSVDLCGVSAELRQAAIERVRRAGVLIDDAELLLAATHTHSGPGGYVSNLLFMSAAGVYQQEIFDRIADAIANAVISARRGEARANAFVAQARLDGFQTNRRDEPSLNPTLTAIRFDGADGRAIAALLHYPGHPTTMNSRDLRISRDWPGAAVDRVAEGLGGGTICAFLNGAAGDLRVDSSDADKPAAGSADRYARAQRVGEAIGERALSLIAEPSAMLPATTLAVSARAVEMRPQRAAMLIGMRQPVLQRVQLGPLVMFTVPGEAVCEIGESIADLAPPSPARAIVVGLANDYLGYFVTQAQSRAGGYEPTMAFFGNDAGARLREAYNPPAGHEAAADR